jgi:hypothetical protein
MATECPRCHSRLVTNTVAVNALRHGAVTTCALLLDKAITHAAARGSSASGLKSTVAVSTAAALLKHLASQQSNPTADPHTQLRCWRCQHTFPVND